jgi:hypothetical protein
VFELQQEGLEGERNLAHRDDSSDNLDGEGG